MFRGYNNRFSIEFPYETNGNIDLYDIFGLDFINSSIGKHFSADYEKVLIELLHRYKYSRYLYST